MTGFEVRPIGRVESSLTDPASAPKQGVFNTRSADRPNPIGLHEVELLAVEGERLHMRPLEAVDGTPEVDLKPVL